MDGFLCIDKPAGGTSRDIVNQVQRLVRPLKVGHAGTLDPLATGVLVVALGKATRLIRYVQQSYKEYVGVFALGQTSDTEDITGNVVRRSVLSIPTPEQVDQVCRRFVGEIRQRPPAYSALKVQGRRAYDLARRGEHVELPARPVMVHKLEVLRYAYPELELRVRCGSGTYLRSLGRDIGEELACGAAMASLRRTLVGAFTEATARGLEDLSSLEALERHLLPAISAVKHLPATVVVAKQIRSLAFGQKILLDQATDAEIVAVDHAGQLQAVLARTDKGDYRPAINFC